MAGSWPVQQDGSNGEDARTVQYLLMHHGFRVTVDGTFGPVTAAMVHEFQASKGLTQDGIVGDHTWPALIVRVSSGDSGDAVSAAQAQLRSQGWRLALDGAFGPQTDRSVRDYQVVRGLVPDGDVGPNTWHRLVADFDRVGTAEAAASHLYDAWGANDRRTAMRNATAAAVDLVMRGERGDLNNFGCAPNPQFGPGSFICTYGWEGGGVNLHVEGDDIFGYYVGWASFFVD